MFPLIPEGFVNPQLTLFFALVLGIGFGYILEQAGFSSSRKLAGLFYGYDFVVLRVFFTAGVTAMTGLMFLSYLGWVDMNLVYVNPTFLWSAIIGGLIMGFGFIIGGFCPGTSLVGAVIGKVDAMVFVGGMLIGMFIFGHFYHVFEPVYTGHFLGHIFLFDTLGISKAWFAFILAMVALLAFAVTQMIEDRVNGTSTELIATRPSYRIPSALLAISLLFMLFLPSQRNTSFAETRPSQIMTEWDEGNAMVSAQKVVYDIMHGNKQVVLVDMRSPEQYQRFSLPGAINIQPAEILGRSYRDFFRNDPRQKVFLSDGSALAAQGWHMARRAGFDNVCFLEGGLNGVFEMVFTDKAEEDNNNYLYSFSERFAKEARQFFSEGGAKEEQSSRQVPVQTIIEINTPTVAGGC